MRGGRGDDAAPVPVRLFQAELLAIARDALRGGAIPKVTVRWVPGGTPPSGSSIEFANFYRWGDPCTGGLVPVEWTAYAGDLLWAAPTYFFELWERGASRHLLYASAEWMSTRGAATEDRATLSATYPVSFTCAAN